MRPIDADALKKFFFRPYSHEECYSNIDIERIINKQPTIELKRKPGRWINAYPDIEPNPMFMYGICSECGFEQSISNKLNFCPNCGMPMVKGDHDEC